MRGEWDRMERLTWSRKRNYAALVLALIAASATLMINSVNLLDMNAAHPKSVQT